MYMVVDHVAATYAGQWYTSFVEECIFVPLGMSSSTFSLIKAGKFTQGWTKEGRRVPEHSTKDTAFVMAGPGGFTWLISNAVNLIWLVFTCRFRCIWTLRSP